QVAKQIHDDGIDILIDIAGHTGHNRLGVFARRPAPVQMTWLDYLCTTGLAAMNYRITDAIADPEGNEVFHSEKVLRMPHTQWCWQPDGSAPDVSAPPSERNGCITFGSFNNAQKLTDSTLALWRALLNALPEARMRIGGIADGFARARVLEALGCQESRLTFLPRLDIHEYRQSFAEVDIALDPTPFSGATTTLDALWQGVPVLTLPGERSCSRSSASLLSALAMNAWIASDADDFVGLAKRHSADRQGLIELRKGLRGRMQASPMLDVGAFTADLENLYRRAWRDWCESRIAADGAPSLPAGEHDALIRARSAMGAGQIDAAMTVLKPLVAAHPDWEIAKRDLARAALAWSRAHPEALPVWSSPVPKTSRRKVSAIVCSIRPDYFNAVRARLGEQFADHDFELIGIHDAKSLCEGYNRGAARAMGDVLIFCHDDIDTVHDDFGERVFHHLAHHDVLGVVGTSRLVGGDWGYAGAPHVHGQVVHRPPGETGFIYLGVGLQAPVITGIQALDGVFIATHRHVWEALKFDEATFDGFHLYDIDFTWRAHLAGYRLAVPLDLLLLHFSTGRYDMKWQAFHRRFLNKFPQLSGRPSARRYTSLHVKLQTLEQVERLHSGLFHHNFGA
ncbi:MAG: hypothetical protein JNN20_13775, partial [Betaproteobacteria bacterium]|nr:hypothetical protein [Betaproteobacteria bacterium]